MSQSSLKVAYLTAGAAGMYCGSCMHDNTLAAALDRLGVDVQLIPTYTPIRTDEHDVSVDRVFFGGVNVYLQQRFPLCRYIPAFLSRFLDRPRFLRWVTARGVEIDPRELGELTVSMLKGEYGHQRNEVRRLCTWLRASVQPDLVTLTNVLIGGSVVELKRRLNIPILVTLQGDDVFLEQLPEPHKSNALTEIRRLAEHVDGFVVNSRYYADFMGGYLDIPPEKLHIVPLGIDTRDVQELLRSERLPQNSSRHSPSAATPRENPVNRADGTGTVPATLTRPDSARPPTIGYLARLAPEKGLHILVDAFIELRKQPDMGNVQLRLAGWLGEHNREYAEAEFAKLKAAGLEQAFQYVGTVDRQEKFEFLTDVDVLSVPATYREPKGLYVLEALAAGVPVVQPSHGAFPELLETTGGGWLTKPDDPVALTGTLREILVNPTALAERGAAGSRVVYERLNAESMAHATLEVYRKYL